MRRVLGIGSLLVAVGLAGCGGDGGGAAVAAVAPPASVAGTWSDPVPQNGGAAILTACTGALQPANNFPWNQVFEVCTSGGLPVAQNGPAAALVPTAVVCPGGSVDVVGAGIALDGSSFQGLWHEVEPDTPAPGVQTVTTHFFTGSVAGPALSLSASRVEVRGGLTGGCAITPALTLTSTITP